MSKPLIVIGNGGHASVLIEMLLAKNEIIVGFTNPHLEINEFNIPYLGNDDIILNYSPDQYELVLGIGMVKPSSLRSNLYNYFKNKGYLFKKVIHHSAVISPSVKLGDGVQIMAGSIIQSHAVVSDNSIVNTGAIVEHDSVIGAHTHVASGATICGNVNIKNGAHIGAGSIVIQGITVGEKCLVGAGAVVVRNVPDYKKVVGVPAKEV